MRNLEPSIVAKAMLVMLAPVLAGCAAAEPLKSATGFEAVLTKNSAGSVTSTSSPATDLARSAQFAKGADGYTLQIANSPREDGTYVLNTSELAVGNFSNYFLSNKAGTSTLILFPSDSPGSALLYDVGEAWGLVTRNRPNASTEYVNAYFGGEPTKVLPTGTVNYSGPLAGAGVVGANTGNFNGTTALSANFTNATFSGNASSLSFKQDTTGTVTAIPNVNFSGAMTGNTFATTNVTMTGATTNVGRLQGGIFGANGFWAAGVINLQSTGVPVVGNVRMNSAFVANR